MKPEIQYSKGYTYNVKSTIDNSDWYICILNICFRSNVLEIMIAPFYTTSSLGPIKIFVNFTPDEKDMVSISTIKFDVHHYNDVCPKLFEKLMESLEKTVA